MLKDVDEEYRTTIITFSKYKLVTFAIAKLMEMETLEIQAGDLREEPGERAFDPTVYSYKCPCCRRNNYLRYIDLSEEIRFDLDN